MEFLLGRPKTIAVIFYQHDDSVGTSNWALQILDKFRRLHRILPRRHPLHPQPRLHSLLLGSNSVNYPASFESLVLIEACGMDIHS
jgi:hypothetical protein